MIRLSKSVLAVGGGVLAGGLITVMAPKTVHAVAAALVEVANTAANPVVSSEVSRTAAQTISVYSGLQAVDGTRTPFQEMIPGGGLQGDAFVVPDGENFVITEIDIGSGLGGAFQLLPATAGPTGGSANQIFQIPGDNLTHQFLFPNGIVWPSGHNIPYSASTGMRVVIMRGYLTRN